MGEEWQQKSRKQTKQSVLERFLNYLRNRGDVHVDNEELIQGLTQHFHLLPTRYALDVTTESLDILNHFNLLREARNDHAAVFFHVRLVEAQLNITYANRQNSQSNPVAIVHTNTPPNSSSSQPQDIPMAHYSQNSRFPKPAFGSSPGLQSLGVEAGGLGEAEEGGSGVAAGADQYVSTYFWEVTVASIDQPRLLSKLTDALGDVGLSIREAHVFNTADGMALDVFVTEGWTADGKDGLEQALGQRFGRLTPPPVLPPVMPSITEGQQQILETDLRTLQYMQQQQTQTPLNDWEIDINQLQMQVKIGQGQFGTLYKGIYCGQSVAIKILKDVNASAQQYQEFQQEIAIMRKIRHKNVVQFIGACTQKPHLCILFEFMSGGSLFEHLKVNGPLNMKQVLKVGMDVSHGMDYLHRMGVIHRDLKAANLLLDENFVVKIGDFGVARILSNDGVMTAETGTYRWMAPEVVEHRPYGPMADVFSFAIVLWELLTAHVPYQNMTPLQAAVGVVQKGMRPTLPTDVPEQLQKVIQACWQQKPEKRPTFEQLHNVFTQMYNSHSDQSPCEHKASSGKKQQGGSQGILGFRRKQSKDGF